MNRLLCFVVFILLSALPYYSIAQPDENKIKEYLLKPKFEIDTTAEAIVLFERTDVEFIYTRLTSTETRTIHKVIKIMHKNALQLADIKIYIPNGNDRHYVHKIAATTYNLVGKGVQSSELSKSDFFKSKLTKYYKDLSFTLPNVKEGSIIDYTYELVTPIYYKDMMPQWKIQDTIPKLISEYTIIYPASARLSFVQLARIPSKEFLNINDAISAPDSFCNIKRTQPTTVGDNFSMWIRKNIPGIKKEVFVQNRNNYLELMCLKLTWRDNAVSESWSKLNAINYTDSNTWRTFGNIAWNSAYPKAVREPNIFLAETVKKLVGSDTEKIIIAKNIYDYVRQNFKVVDSSIPIYDSLTPIFYKKEGSKNQINGILTAMLLKAGLDANLIFISTTKNRAALGHMFMASWWNYEACAVLIDSNYLFLDATDKSNIFSILPLECYNGYARIISKAGDSVYLLPEQLLDKNVTSVKISFPNKTTQHVEIVKKVGIISSYLLRKTYRDSLFVEQKICASQMPLLNDAINIIETKVDNYNDPDKSIVIKIVCDTKVDLNVGTYVHNTSFLKTITENPFTATQREYPIEYPYRSQNTYSIGLEVPVGFTVDSVLPKPVILKVGENGLSFEKQCGYYNENNLFTTTTTFKNETTVYSKTEHDKIKAFYADILKEENQVIELRKK